MKKGTLTKRAIVAEGLHQAQVAGLESVSIGPLAKALSMSKSGLFAHFESREGMQLAIADHAYELFMEQVVRPGLEPSGAVDRLRRTFALYLDWVLGSDEDGGCLFVSMAQEYDDKPGPLRDWLVRGQADWQAHLRRLVAGAVDAGELPLRTDPAQIVFEMMGIALSLRHSARLLSEPQAQHRADLAFERLIAN